MLICVVVNVLVSWFGYLVFIEGLYMVLCDY